ncbi:MAG: hypothetical protein PF481_06205 [Bacteroidales bacterium]|jgi:hypothetical protein|nr:hypothetical protein [Bacteroidales bacterium]
MKKFSLFIIGISFASFIFAQNFQDALRYSESFPLGNARFTAMSGAFGSLGGNISGLTVNPAGSAVFKKNAIEFTPAFLLTKTQNYYLGSYNGTFNSSMAIPNFGVVFTQTLDDNELFVSGISFAFGINRTNDFNSIANFNTFNTKHSLTDDFLRRANAGSSESNYTDLAWETYLFDYDSTANMYESDFHWYDNNYEYTLYGIEQDITINRGGSMKEYTFNLGVDFSEVVYLGASFNIEAVSYTESFDIKESDDAGNYDYLNSFVYSTKLDVSGSGVNGKIGLIVKPNESIRLGLAAHTPTMYSLYEEYDAKINAQYDVPINGYDYSMSQDYLSDFSYKVLKPGKFITSASYIYKNIAMVGIDYESINYSYSQLSASSESFSNANNEITTELQSVNNLKIGAELRYGPFSFRGGMAFYDNPYKNLEFEQWFYKRNISGGVGISNNNFYCDLSWVKSKQFGYEALYSDFNSNTVSAKSDTYSDNFFLTFGIKF